MKRIIALVTLALLYAAPAHATCTVAEVFEAGVAAQEGLSVRKLEGKTLEQAAAMYNNMPPVSDVPVATAYMIEIKDGGGFLAVGPAGFICGGVRFNPDQWADMKRNLFGVGA